MSQDTFYKTLFFFLIAVSSSNTLFGMESGEPLPVLNVCIAKYNEALECARRECAEIAQDIEALSTPLENIQIYAILDGITGELSQVCAHHSGYLSGIEARVEKKCNDRGWFQCQLCAKKLEPKTLFPLISKDISLLFQNQLICSNCAFGHHIPWIAHRATPLCPTIRPIVKKLQIFHANARRLERPFESESVFCDYCASKLYDKNHNRPDLVRLPCGHIFHVECFAPFASKFCPHCCNKI